MKRFCIVLAIAASLFLITGCQQQTLEERAAELCRYIPDHELLSQSKDYMTEDFYNLLDTMFYRLPEHEAMDHEWLYYFVTGNGGTIADYEVQRVKRTDDTHAVATILVRQKWEDGSFAAETDIEEHRMYMERVNGVWLMSDFDEHKQDCIRYIAINRHEQAVRKAVSRYLVTDIAPLYLQGEHCIPTLMIVAEDESETGHTLVYGDFWVFLYNVSGDTLKTVSGGNHAGCMTISQDGDSLYVSAFVQTKDGAGNTASAKRIFGSRYDVYESMHANETVREAVRREQLDEFIRSTGLPYRYYQDYGQPAKEINADFCDANE